MLEVELLMFRLKDQEPRVFDLIKKSTPDFTQVIKTKTSEYTELIFKNKVRIKCNQDIYLLSINSKEPIYRNY